MVNFMFYEVYRSERELRAVGKASCGTMRTQRKVRTLRKIRSWACARGSGETQERTRGEVVVKRGPLGRVSRWGVGGALKEDEGAPAGANAGFMFENQKQMLLCVASGKWLRSCYVFPPDFHMLNCFIVLHETHAPCPTHVTSPNRRKKALSSQRPVLL